MQTVDEKTGDQLTGEYIVLRLQSFTDALDVENSMFEKDLIFGGEIGVIKKLVLKEPLSGLPPLFRIQYTPDYYVTEKCKQVLESNKLIGCTFIPVPMRSA